MASGSVPISSDPPATMFQNASIDRTEGSEFYNSARDMFKFVLNNYNFTTEDENASPDIVNHLFRVIPPFIEEILKNNQPQSTILETPSTVVNDPAPQADHTLQGDPVVVTDMIPPEPISLPISSMADRYTRCMLKCLAGYPLYEPEPYSDRSREYLREGINIGDVGFIRGDGTFDFLFNVCPPKNGLINPPGLPAEFSLETPEYSETRPMRSFPQETHLFQIPVIRKSGKYICEGPEGAILELPDGAFQHEATNTRPLAKLAARHGVRWYEYTMNRGRDISNGALYLITSFTKCAQWGMAVFDRPCAPGQSLKFEKRSLAFSRSTSKYYWKGSSDVFPTKVFESNQVDVKNQSVFLRGYKIMIRQDIFDDLCNDQSSSDGGMCSSSSQAGSSIMTRQPATRIRGGAGPDPMSKSLSWIKGSDAGEVVLQANFHTSLVHPSDLVNSALLSQNMNAEVALTHDDVWCDLLRENFPKIKPAILINLAQSYTITVDEYDCVSLVKTFGTTNVVRKASQPLQGIETRTPKRHLVISGDKYMNLGRGTRGGFGRGGGPPPGPLIYSPNEPPSLAPRLNDNVQEQLVSGFRAAGYRAERPLRPGFGKLGTPIKLRANFFAVKLPKGGKGKPKPQGGDPGDSNIRSHIKRRIFELLEAQQAFQQYKPFVAHDFSQRLVAAKWLPQPLEITITFVEEDETQARPGAKVYNVSVQFLDEIDLNILRQYTGGNLQYRDYDMQPIISALNLVLQHHASHAGVRVGKKDSNGESKFFFDPGQNRRQLAPGSEIWQGFFISVRPAFKQLMVNVNVCYTAFMEAGNLADALFRIGGNTYGAMPTLPPSLANSIQVKTKHLNYRKKVFKIGTKTARNTFFKCSEYGNVDISVEQYFHRKYGMRLQHPTDLPVVSLGVIDKNGTKSHNWVPAELCDIVVGLPRRGKLTDVETSNMIRFACNPPSTNARDIVETGLPKLGFTPNSSPVLNSFGIEIENKMSSVPARVLPPPRLTYREGQCDMKEGAWNILNVKFQSGGQVRSWWVLYVNDRQQARQREEIKPLIEALRDKCGRSGMGISKDLPALLPAANLNKYRNDDGARTGALRHIQEIFTQALREKGKPSFVLVLLERVDKCIYPGIKRIGDVTLGIHTVHMQLDKALDQRKQDQYLSNVALKVNTKLGGVNHKLDDGAMMWLRKKPTMIVGIDVTHAGPGSRAGTPSIAAVVASIDDSFVHFPCSLGIQEYDPKKDNKEMVDNLCDMFVERIKAYEGRNKKLPERIFVFRDGVSEGQFSVLLREEYPKILRAFEKLSAKAKYRPQLSIVVCGKRHHAKFPATDAQLADKNGNTKPGTVVDKGVTSIFDYDFYLQAHAGLQGTVKSTHYTVVYDENRFDPDEIQKGTYDTSYLYARATRSVSLIPPAYYADLACKRGRCYLNEFLNAEDRGTDSLKSGKSDLEQERQQVYQEAKGYWGDGVHADMRGTMFYL